MGIAIPIGEVLIEAAAPYVLPALGIGAVGGAGYVLTRNQLSQASPQDKEWMDSKQTIGCWKCDDQRCKKLRDQINGNHDELDKRATDLKEDKLNLPYRAAGDVQTPSLSIWGHEQLFLKHQDQLRDALKEYLTRKCGPVRSSAWGRATQNMPKKD
jgi:hypothetical protein